MCVFVHSFRNNWTQTKCLQIGWKIPREKLQNCSDPIRTTIRIASEYRVRYFGLITTGLERCLWSIQLYQFDFEVFSHTCRRTRGQFDSPISINLFSNEEQIISGCPIDGAISVRVDGGFGSYRWFVYITTLLLRDAFWILILHCGPPEPPQRHLYC